MKQIISIILVLCLVLSLVPAAVAANSDEALEAALRLDSLGLLKGVGTNSDGSTNYDLENGLTREQAVIMLVRLLGKESEALGGGWEMPFTDVSPWATDYVAYAYEKGLANGTGKTTFHGKTPVTAAHYLTFVLRALGYSSETDFAWNSPWDLAKIVGINAGEYNDDNSADFIRADMAVVSSRALDARLKTGGMTLLESISKVCNHTPSDYLDRKLSNTELSALKSASLDTLRAKISTVGDAAAFLDQFSPAPFSGFGDSIHLDIDFLYNLHTRPEATFSQTYTAFAAWCITDDFPGIKYIICCGESFGNHRIAPALALPVKGAYYICSPYEGSALVTPADCEPIAAVEVSSLSALEDVLSVNWTVPKPYQIFVADAEQTDLTFSVDESNMWARVATGTAELVYALDDQDKEALDDAIKQENIKRCTRNLRSNWSNFGFPASFDPTLSENEIESLIGKDINTVSSALKTLGDVLYYLALSGYYTTNGDIKVWEDGLYWSLNESPKTVFSNNAGNCGGTAAFVAYLLTGDYDEAGCLSMTLDVEIGGGHVITYLKDGDSYYVFDSRALVDTYYSWNGGISEGSSLVSAGRNWRDANDPNYKLIFAYPTDDGDLPGMGDGKTVYLPTQYRDRITVVYEATAEGYKFDWRSIGAAAMETIEGIKNPFISTPDKDIAVDKSGNYMNRLLSDSQLAELKTADAKTLQAYISTVADAVAYLDQFEHIYGESFYDRISTDLDADISFMLNLHRTEATGSDVYTMITAWCLADDYPDASILLAAVDNDGWVGINHALLLADGSGYRIISPASHSSQWNCVYGFYEAEINSLDSIMKRLRPHHAGMADDSSLIMYNVCTYPITKTDMDFSLEGNFISVPTGATEIYRISDAELNAKD